MNILLDGIIFSLQHHGGISVYFRELINYLDANSIKSNLYLELPILQKITMQSPYLNIDSRQKRIFERFRNCYVSDSATVFHSSYYRLPSKPNLPSVVTVHDFIYERFRNGPAKWLHMHQKHTAIRRAQALICISESTREDLINYVGVRQDQSVHVIPNGVSKIFRQIYVDPPDRPIVLFVGERRGYKNFALVLSALSYLPDFYLQCVGGGAFREDEFIGFNDSLRSRVHHIGFVTDEILNITYNKSVCLVYPSRYEGFGIPVVEAMRAGCPVVSINCKAVVEIGGDAVLKLEDEDPLALAEAILSLLDPVYRAQHVRAGLKRAEIYGWDLCHSKTLDIYRNFSNI